MKSAKLDWLEEAARAIEYEAQRPHFPGDPEGTNTLTYLNKLVDKLYGECWSGGELGSDGCPPCRAVQTEKALAAQADAEHFFAVVSANREELAKALAVAQTNQLELAREVEDRDRAFIGSQAQVESLSKQLKDSQAQIEGLTAELSAAQKSAQTLAGQVGALTVTTDKLRSMHNTVVRALEPVFKETV